MTPLKKFAQQLTPTQEPTTAIKKRKDGVGSGGKRKFGPPRNNRVTAIKKRKDGVGSGGPKRFGPPRNNRMVDQPGVQKMARFGGLFKGLKNMMGPNVMGQAGTAVKEWGMPLAASAGGGIGLFAGYNKLMQNLAASKGNPSPATNDPRFQAPGLR